MSSAEEESKRQEYLAKGMENFNADVQHILRTVGEKYGIAWNGPGTSSLYGNAQQYLRSVGEKYGLVWNSATSLSGLSFTILTAFVALLQLL